MRVRLLFAAFIGFSSQVLAPTAEARSCNPLKMSDFAMNVPVLIKKMKGDLCWNQGASLIVDIDNRIMFMCLEKRTIRAYPIAHGPNGIPKTQEGDMKTPLGTYPLAEPRRSNDGFNTFILIGYPTEKQAARGLTGSAIGIHGPMREEACDGLESVRKNWTDGCIALPSDPAILTVAEFVRSYPNAPLHVYTRKKLK